MDDKEAYEAKLQAQIDLWQAEIDKLKAKAMDAGADASLKLNEQLHQLLEYQKENQEKLEQLRQTTDEAWKDMKAGMEASMEIFGDAVKSAMSRFIK